MGTDYELNKISKQKHEEFIKVAKEQNISIDEYYNEYGFLVLTELGSWSHNNYFSKLLDKIGVEVKEDCQVILSLSILCKLRIDIIGEIELLFKKHVSDKAKLYKLVDLDYEFTSGITKLIYMINAINKAIKEVDFEKEIVLYYVG